ncbi:MAG: hypothetical protein MOIL_00674 [Candidatus Methanolliviera sp. GoM_oil]|nr:MAG: hypothetical protein MOIL_00674 [Candidatus Methanolliviera sp. GoM_oil]
MSERIGKIERPSVEQFKGKRKICFVPLIYTWKDAPEDYKTLVEDYWKEIREQIANMKERVGKIAKIYHEMIFLSGENGIKDLEKLNKDSYEIVKSECSSGAELVSTEKRKATEECADWERCLAIGLKSERVRTKVSKLYMDASEERYGYVAKRIDKTLKDGESGILFFGENHWIVFPQDIEVFNVYPPSLDDLHRWPSDQLM